MITERDLQEYIWKNRKNWKEMIVPIELPDNEDYLDDENSILALSVSEIIKQRVYNRIKELNKGIQNLSFIGCEVPLNKKGESTIRVDFLAKIPGSTGLSIIELKINKSAERQAYTELLAYANHLETIFPTMSIEDVTLILIAPMEERIVREATILSLIKDDKPVVAFVPTFQGDDLSTLKLTPWVPNGDDISALTEAVFKPSNFDVFKMTWDSLPEWNAEEPGSNPEIFMKERMNKVASYAAQLMENKKINGFVYTAQYWPEIQLQPNQIIIGGLNPYKVSVENYLKSEEKVKSSEIQGIADYIPGLVNTEFDVDKSSDLLEELVMTWCNVIQEITSLTVNAMISNSEGISVLKDHGTFDWDHYKEISTEDLSSFHYNFYLTGNLRELFIDYSLIDLAYINKFGYEKHPNLSHGDVDTFMVDLWGTHWYTRDFLDRLFDPFKDLKDML